MGIKAGLFLLTTCGLCAAASAQDAALQEQPSKAGAETGVETVRITARRLPLVVPGQSTTVLKLEAKPQARLDRVLTAEPGVSLFRRGTSQTAHPTTQGLTLRGVGANAAGRVLVLEDGVPLNDPFGGWIYWSALDAGRFETASVFKGGGSGAFGAQALAGAVSLTSRAPTETGGRASLSYGRFEEVITTAAFDLVGRKGYVSVDGGYQDRDGPFLLRARDRGPADARFRSEALFANARAARKLGDNVTVVLKGGYYKDERLNGIDTAFNETEGYDVSVRLLGEASDGPEWEVVAYWRRRDFDNIFVSADDARQTTRPVLDQFDVPGKGYGFLARARWGALELGVDGRKQSGETNENFRNLGAGFTRVRLAGGDQWILGSYASYEAAVQDVTLGATVRLDRSRTYDGERVERDIASGAVLREENIHNRSDWTATGRLGASWQATPAITVRGAAYKSWRLPTINEYFRPFRVVNDITEANADLSPETLYGIEAGAVFAPLNTVRFDATVYQNWLQDGVGNVTIGFGPGFFPLGGFVPAGGVLRQRTNIDRQKTTGLEVAGSVSLQTGMTASLRYLYARARVTRFDAQPALEGLRPVQTPKHTVTGSLEGEQGPFDWSVAAFYQSGQFDDDQNLRALGDAFTVDASVGWRLRDGLRLFARAENLFGAEVISARTAGGLETLAQPMSWQLGLSARF